MTETFRLADENELRIYLKTVMVIYLLFNARYEPLLYNSASNDHRCIRLGGERRTFRTKHKLDILVASYAISP